MGGMCSLFWERKRIKSLKPKGERKLRGIIEETKYGVS
jgi:hypothetical protein